ncbi:hypothetical protein BG015_010955 [Linnemannia schmuckeri]|uniref:Uncharacterized protein n=1 Tax=Linnemannia schmuckeri TaxID=64567 RepID=A0A9P5RWU8_9FUNG|nr:hypothetical protein BG015_010955 [Linnemannia schmuckeri]
MLRLVHYTSVYSTVSYNPEPTYSTNYILQRHEPHKHQLLWLLRLNWTTLTNLQLIYVPRLSSRLIRSICRTISQLDHLRILQLISPTPPTKFSSQVVEALFFSCPGSLVEFTLGPAINYLKGVADLDLEEGDWDYDQGPLVPRQEPLSLLKILEVPAMNVIGGYPLSTLRSILQHCPAPENTFLIIMEQIQERQLESIHVVEFYDEFSKKLINAAFMRHSDTLHQVQFSDCHQLKSCTLQAILVSCRALEIFKVSKAVKHARSSQLSLSLEDAVVNAWACTDIQKLAITVSLTSDGRDPAYFADPIMATWIEQDHDHWKMLDKFYTHIGLLKKLTYLNLEGA